MIKNYLPKSNVKVTIIIETITPAPPSTPSTSKMIQFPGSTEFIEGSSYVQ